MGLTAVTVTGHCHWYCVCAVTDGDACETVTGWGRTRKFRTVNSSEGQTHKYLLFEAGVFLH